MTVYWAPFLHAYQPPWQSVEVFKQIYKECYMPLLSMLERHQNVKITINIQGCLLDQFAELNLIEARDIMRDLIDVKKIELVGSAKYHPILPLIPPNEITHQIKLNNIEISKHFPKSVQKGFFPPEMAVSPELCSIIKNSGFEWMIMDGIANTDTWPNNYIQKSSSSLLTFFRDTYISNLISFNKIDAQGFVNHLLSMNEKNPSENYYIITAQDAETFGHHIKYYETSFLGKVFSLIEDIPEIQISFISDLKNNFPIQNGKAIRSSSWSTDWSDISSNVPYPLWIHPLNPVHKYQYRMLKALYKLMEILDSKAPKDTKNENFLHYYTTARYFYDEALHSCWLWWGNKVSMWSPNLIYKGIDLVMKTALNAQLALINLKFGVGDELYSIIMDNNEKLMNEMIVQESQGQQLKTFGTYD